MSRKGLPKLSDEAADRAAGVAAYLVKAFAVVAGVFTVLGVTGGVLGRMVRNEGELTAIALVAASVAVLLGVIARAIDGNPKRRWRLLAAGLVLCLVATVAAIVAGVRVWEEQTAPRIVASVGSTPRGPAIDLDVTSSGLGSDERVQVSIWPVTLESEAGPAEGSREGAPETTIQTQANPLYRTILGPDAEGNVDFVAKAPLPSAHPGVVVVEAGVGEPDPEHCLHAHNRSGCVVLDLGEPGQPQLSATWKELGGRPALEYEVSVTEALPTPLRLRIFGLGGSGVVPLAAANLVPNASGRIEQAIEVPVPAGVASVCAVADPMPHTGCPPGPVRMPAADLAKCVARDEANGVQTDGHPSKAILERGCRAGYVTYEREGAAWLRVATP